MVEYTVLLKWDDVAYVWMATSADIPGLALESGSLDALIERVKTASPEILEMNGKKHDDIKLCFKAERVAVVA
jgi:hypothetical protein